MKIGKCKLCLADGVELQDSHFLPKGVYKILRDDDAANPNPWIISDRKTAQISFQLKAHLFCRDCEQRLNRQGEKWVLSNCLKKDGSFPLASFLASRLPDIFSDTNPTRVYFAAKIPEIDCPALAYFAASMFWRGSIHGWSEDGAIPVKLGPFQESFRQYLIGQEDFPVPIPLVRTEDAWHFDTASGREEILARRIGKNELDAIQSSLAYVDAQNEYAEKDRTGAGANIYAKRIVSRPGKKDGLYWPAAQGEEPSPLGELVAQATARGYRVGGGRTPYNGYYFKVLTKQGAAAPGGEMEYIVHGKMIGGFALVAYPAEYRNSGVMTFIVNHAGIVYQKDLGPATDKLAARMSAFNPDKSWQKVADTTPVK